MATSGIEPSSTQEDSRLAISASSGAPQPNSAFHLVESAGSWTLTITLPQGMLAALASTESNGQAPRTDDLELTVRVEPNLVPGEPFVAKTVFETYPVL